MSKRRGAAQSPYQKYGKAPYQYSAHLRAWQNAKKAGHDRSADDAARAHENQFGYKRDRRAIAA
jgi:hypothetical protein